MVWILLLLSASCCVRDYLVEKNSNERPFLKRKHRDAAVAYELRGTYQVAGAATSGTRDCLELIQNQKSVHSQVEKQPAKITLVITKNTQPYIHIEEQKAAVSFVGYQAHFRNDFLKEA